MEKPGHENFKWFTTSWHENKIPNWEKWLAPLKGKENIRFLEVGSWEGQSALWLCENVMAKNCRLYCIDTWYGNEDGREFSAGIYGRFTHNLKKHIESGMVIPLIGDSRYVLAKLSNMVQRVEESLFNFAYIDGSHRAQDVITDMCIAWSLLYKGGIMIMDDYEWGSELPKIEQPKLAIDSFLECFLGSYEIIGKEYQVALRKI